MDKLTDLCGVTATVKFSAGEIVSAKDERQEEINELKTFIEDHHLKSVFDEWKKRKAEREVKNAEANI